MSYAGPDPAMNFEKCVDCGEDADFDHSPEVCAKNRPHPCIDCGTLFKGVGRLCNRCFCMVKL